MNTKEEKKNSINRIELEGNVAGFGTPYEISNNRKRMRFDLAQNRGDETHFIPIVLPNNLVNSYGAEIQKGDWISVKGAINSFQKTKEKNGKTINIKELEIIAFEIEDRRKNKLYSNNIKNEKLSKNNSMER